MFHASFFFVLIFFLLNMIRILCNYFSLDFPGLLFQPLTSLLAVFIFSFFFFLILFNTLEN